MKEVGDYKRARNWAVFYAILCLLWRLVSNVVQVTNVQESTKFIVLFAGALFCPISIIISWLICISKLHELEITKSSTRINQVWWWICVSIICLLGIAFIWSIKDIIDYVIWNWRLLDGIYHCIGIKAGMSFGWGMLWIGSVKSKAVICSNGKNGKKTALTALLVVVMLIMVYVRNMQEDYVYWETEDVWFEKMVEEYEENKGE